MADLLTHLFLPLTAVYVFRPGLFESPAYLGISGFALLSDFDKFLGQPGLLHSLLTLGVICAGILAIERAWKGRYEYAPVVCALILSHLVLDVVDGGPVPLLYPLVETGIGLQYPIQTVFGAGPLGLTFEGALVSIRITAPAGGFNTYGFIDGTGVANALLFATIYLCRGRWRSASAVQR